MSWACDDVKLDRVRALMAEQDLDALVVRAPDNVLYLTNFWGMKGFDAVVFPREGEPVLITLTASEEDAAEPRGRAVPALPRATTPPIRARRGSGRSTLAQEAAAAYGTVGLELSLGTQATDRMVGEPTTFTKAWFDAFPAALDATPLLNEARSIKTRRRSSGCGSPTRSPRPRWSMSRGDPAGDDRGAGRRRVAGLRPRRGHGLAGQGRARARRSR